MIRFLQRASLPAIIAIVLADIAPAATHIAAATRQPATEGMGVGSSSYQASLRPTKSSVPSPSKDARNLPIDVASSKVDYKGDTVTFQDVVITQGDTKVQADRAHATGLDDFDNSHWTFEGNVRINGEQHGSLKSDQAVVEFRNKYISKATITGNPAEFEQKRADTAEIARGHAHQIVYNVNDGTVRLLQDAWLSDGHNSISGAELVYNIREQHVQGSAQPGSDDRVHLTIDPNTTREPNKKP